MCFATARVCEVLLFNHILLYKSIAALHCSGVSVILKRLIAKINSNSTCERVEREQNGTYS